MRTHRMVEQQVSSDQEQQLEHALLGQVLHAAKTGVLLQLLRHQIERSYRQYFEPALPYQALSPATHK